MPKTEKEHTEQYYAKVDAIVNMLLEEPQWILRPRSHELTEMVKKKLDVKYDMATKYIRDAKAEFRKKTSGNFKTKQTKIKNMYLSLIRRAQKTNKLGTERLAIRDLATILGVYVEKADFNHTIEQAEVVIIEVPENGRDNEDKD